MAAEPFNSRGGYTVGIPPVPLFDANGNLTCSSATFGGNVSINGSGIFSGNIQANVFQGTFEGNISGNLVVPGGNTWVVFNDNGQANTNPNFTFDQTALTLTVNGNVVANSLTLGTGGNEFSSQRIYFATTASSAPDQVLYQVQANTVCAIDFTVIATDTLGNSRQISKLFAGILDTNVEYNEYGTIDVPQEGPGVGNLYVVYSSGNVQLQIQPVTANLCNYKIMVTSYKE